MRDAFSRNELRTTSRAEIMKGRFRVFTLPLLAINRAATFRSLLLITRPENSIRSPGTKAISSLIKTLIGIRRDFKFPVDSSRMRKVVFGELTREPNTFALVFTGSPLTTPSATTSWPTSFKIALLPSEALWALKISAPKQIAKRRGASALLSAKIAMMSSAGTTKRLKSAKKIPSQIPIERARPFRARVDSLSSQRILDQFQRLFAGLRYLQRVRSSRGIPQFVLQ